jgi:AcrR family transcriptional regulator
MRAGDCRLPSNPQIEQLCMLYGIIHHYCTRYGDATLMNEQRADRDPKRTMELLWRVVEPLRPGPKPTLDVDQVLTAAIAVADKAGLSAVTMRAVAERLGKSTMSVYTYIPSRPDLLDLMYDHVLGELPTSYRTDNGWRSALETATSDQWTFYDRHPWVLDVNLARPALGPNSLAVFETHATILADTGLSAVEVTRAAGAIHVFVQNAIRAIHEAQRANTTSGLTDDEWWAIQLPLMNTVTERADWQARYPTLTRLESERAFDQPKRSTEDNTSYLERDAIDTFRFGLNCLLDGLAATIASRRPTPKPQPKAPRRGSAGRERHPRSTGPNVVD